MIKQELRRIDLEMKEKRLQDTTNTHDVKMRDESDTCVKVASDDNFGGAMNGDCE